MNGPPRVSWLGRRGILLLLIAVLAVELWLTFAASVFAWWRDFAPSWARLMHGATRDLAAWPGHILLSLWSVADLVVVPLTLAGFWHAVPTPAPAQERSDRGLRQRYGQFRLATLLAVVTLCGVVFGISRGTGLHPALVLAGMLYCSGPWTAILAGVLMRMWRPHLEHRATSVTLLVVLLIGIGFSFVSTVINRPYAIGLRDLSRITAILWTPQVILCFVLRRLLLPLDVSEMPVRNSADRIPFQPKRNRGFRE